jgi:hypothetical protein
VIKPLVCSCILVAVACSSGRSDRHDASKGAQVQPDNDFLLAHRSTHDLYAAHVHDGPDEVARVRAALRDDPRAEVRRNALVALTASQKAAGMADYIAALDDRAPEVATEAAAALASWAPAYLDRPEHAEAIAALRAHAPALRDALGATRETTRYNAVRALRVIADPDTDLAVVLGDESPLVRAEGVLLAGTRSLGADDVARLDRLAVADPEPRLRWSALVQIIQQAPPELSVPSVSAALARGDVDRTTADAVAAKQLAGAIPAILTFLQGGAKGFQRTEWLGALMSFRPVCAARTIAGLLSDPTVGPAALDALRALSGRRDAAADQLRAWAEEQPAAVPPCTAGG